MYVVRRGSHVHHTFHAGFAQIAPLAMAASVNTMPSSADETARLSHLRRLVRRYPMLPSIVTRKATMLIHALGTWK